MAAPITMPTGIRKRGSSYYWNKQVGGKRIYGSAKSLKQAIKDRDKSDIEPDVKENTITLKSMSDSMLKHYENCAENTYKSAQSSYKLWQSIFGADYQIKNITTKLIDDTVNDMLQTHKKSTVITRLTYLTKLLKTAQDYSYLAAMPVIHWPGKAKGRVRFFTTEEEQDILANMPTEEDKKIVIILIDTGMRKAECLNLTLENIDIQNNLIRLWKTKGEKPRIVPMTERVRDIISNEIKTLDSTQLLFPDMTSGKFQEHWDRMRNLIGKENDKDFVIHACRHTCASRLIQKGVSIPIIQKWLGHTSITTTMRYAHLTDDGLFEALEILEKQ